MFAPIFLSFLCFFQDNHDLVINEAFRVEYVLLDVLAYDRKGSPITDLKKEDFIVTDGGKPVSLELFEVLDYRNIDNPEYSNDYLEKAETGIQPEELKIILALDFEDEHPIKAQKIMDELYRFLDEINRQMRFVIDIYDLERGSITKGFTRSLNEAKSALATYKARHFDEATGKGYQSMFAPKTQKFSGGMGSGLTTLPPGSTKVEEFQDAIKMCRSLGSDAPACISDTVNEFLENHAQRTERVLGELEILTYKYKEFEGLKTMLLVSGGFNLFGVSSLSQLIANPDPWEESRGFGPSNMSRPVKLRPLDNDFNRVVHACVKNRIVFYNFDPFNGDRTGRGNIGRYAKDMAEGLQELAIMSGGQFFQSLNIKNLLEETLTKNRYYYVLGYSSPDGPQGRFRKIEIGTNRKRVKLNYRRGYFKAGN